MERRKSEEDDRVQERRGRTGEGGDGVKERDRVQESVENEGEKLRKRERGVNERMIECKRDGARKSEPLIERWCGTKRGEDARGRGDVEEK